VLSWEDFRENPGTLALAASWLLLFALILLVQWYHPSPLPPIPWWEPLKVSIVTSHPFGDMTWLEVRHGQYWRLLTATFVHFGLVHVGLNTLMLITMGRLVEPWYRTGPFLAICLAMGGFGNLVGGALRQVVGLGRPWLASAAAARHWPGAIEKFLRGGAAFPEFTHSGGGSTILLGLLALGAVVGWRSRTRVGSHLQKQMLILLGLTAVLGLAMSGLVDNYGHLGGAIVGAAIGLFDRPLVRLSEYRWFRAICWALVLGVLAACLGSAIRADRFESDHRRELDEAVTRARVSDTLRGALHELHAHYAARVLRPDPIRGPSLELDTLALADLLSRGPRPVQATKPLADQAARDRADMVKVLDLLDQTRTDLWGEEFAADIARLRALGRSSLEDHPTYDQVYEFVVCWISAEKVIAADLARFKARLVELEKARKDGR
jgi:rhomboid protease GluP